MRAGAIIVAAGDGRRLGAAEAKAFVRIGDRSLLERVVDTLQQAPSVATLVVVAPAADLDRARALVEPRFRPGIEGHFTSGGAERQDSVSNGLRCLPDDCELVVVHDAARPFVRPELVAACLEMAKARGAATAAIPARDTVKEIAADGRVVRTLDRSVLWMVQTPQAFRADLLRQAHARALKEGVRVTDDAALIEHCGGDVWVVRGDEWNLKITTPGDLDLARAAAAAFLAAR